MKPIDSLINEHRVIEQVLDCLEKMAETCEREGSLPADAARDAVDFFRDYADGCHHAKEEDQLFPMMELRGFPRDEGPVAAMRQEHERGRDLVHAMAANIDEGSRGDESARGAWAQAARDYILFLREHIQKEDHCLFPMAVEFLGEADQGVLAERFERVEREKSATVPSPRRLAGRALRRPQGNGLVAGIPHRGSRRAIDAGRAGERVAATARDTIASARRDGSGDTALV
jgi:hemerythrin-like domain-containing protein